MRLNCRILNMLIAGAFVAAPGLADNAFAAKKKKLTYEQAWEACKTRWEFLERLLRQMSATHAALPA